MTHIMPTFKKTYPLFLLFILFCVNNVQSSPNLHQEVVFVNANSASLSELQKDDTAVIIDYTVESSALQQVDKTPVPGDNVKGILFTVNDPCSVITDATSIPSKIPSKLKSNQMIAVIARSSNCTDQKQLLNAQTFGAIGAIIYDVSAPSSSVVIDSSNTITIPTYKINTSSGKQLSDDVRAYANETPSDKGSRIILITMDSSTPNSFGSGWQIAIIVIGSVLAVSFLISVLIHCRLYQLRRHERNAMMAQHEANAISKLEKFKLEESVVKSFPTVVYSKQLHVKKSGSKTESSPTTSSPPSSPGDVRRLSLLTEDGSSNDICPICLEEFVEGETLRQLPSCSHLYHIDCVDKWLTTKSSECPLCKKDSTPPEVAQKREKRFVKTIEVHYRLDNIYDTSNNRSRRDSTTTNGRSPSRLSTFLGFFGYGTTNEYNDSQSRIHPSGSSLFAIQEIPSVAYRSSRSENRFDNLNRIV